MISFDDFGKLELRIGTVRKAEKVEDADKLLMLEVDIGRPVTLVAGIAEEYQPGDLEGRQVVVLANLESKSLRGIESQGMVLAAVDGSRPVLLAADSEVPPGTRVR